MPLSPVQRWRLGLAALLLVGLLNGLWWIQHKSERWYPGQDSEEYRILAINLLEGRGFSRDVREPFLPAIHREPGYPAFVAAIYAVSGRNDVAVVLVQSLLVGVSAVLTALIGRAVFGGSLIPLVGGALVAVSLDLGDHARYLMSEAVFVPLLLASLLATLHAWQRRSWQLGLLAGALFGLTGYVRVMALAMGLLLVFGTLALDWLWRVRTTLRHTLWAPALVLVLLAAPVPWVVRNVAMTGNATFTGRSGGFVIPRADKAAMPIERQARLNLTALWAVTYPFSQLVVPISAMHTPPNIWDGPLGDLELLDTTRAFQRYCNGIGTVVEEDRCQFQEGLRLIRENPLEYVYMTPLEWVRLTFYIYPSRLSIMRNWLTWLALGTIVLCLISARRRTAQVAWLALCIAAYTLPSIAGDTQPRYGVPLVPLYTLFAAAGIVWLASRIAARFSARRSPQRAAVTS